MDLEKSESEYMEDGYAAGRLAALREVQTLMMSKTSAVLYLDDIDELMRRENRPTSCAACVGWVKQTCTEAEADGQWDGCTHWGIPTLRGEKKKCG